jgi:uncharacterized membrane protein YhhN
MGPGGTLSFEDPAAIALSVMVLAMLVYGLALVGRAPSLLRTVVKTLGVAALAVAAALQHGPWVLVAALAACAIGDAFLSRDPKRWLPAGLLAFLVGHALYITLFAAWKDPLLDPGPVRLAGFAALAALAVTLLAFLWSHLGVLRPAVVLYVIVISVTTGFSFMLDAAFWPAMVGSAAFLASHAVLAVRLFRDEVLFGSIRATDWTVWFLYCAAQIGITAAFLSL